MGGQGPQRLGIRNRNGVLELMAHQPNGIGGCLEGEPGGFSPTQTHAHRDAFGAGGQVALAQWLGFSRQRSPALTG